MNLTSYIAYFISVAIGAVGLCILVGFYIARRSLGERFVSVTLHGIITRRNIQQEQAYLVCDRTFALSTPKYRNFFLIISMLIILACFQVFAVLCIIEISYECLNSPNLDCFKMKDRKWSDFYELPYEQTPINCSAILSSDVVMCFRFVLFDPDRFFVGAATAYLTFKILKFGLLLISYLMLWIASKGGNKLVILQVLIAVGALGTFALGSALRYTVKEFESVIQNFSVANVNQMILATLIIMLYVVFMPWKILLGSPKYFVEVSMAKEEQQLNEIHENDDAV